jgi:LmbE family N-acetylglucosaminyl deacetylase
MKEIHETQMGASSIVFSPHPDDETLGCGGTIARKKKLGSKLKIVFVTDGRRSHLRLMSGDEMTAVRQKEAIEASRVLGLDKDEFVFLGYRSGELLLNWNSCVSVIKQILIDARPEEVFIPFRGEPVYWGSGDHIAVSAIVLSALRAIERELVVNEYPIGFWDSWPWTQPPAHTMVQQFGAVKNGVFSSYRLLRDFRCFVKIGEFLDTKLAALDQYKSQLSRFKDDPTWHSLADVSNGEFLNCFIQEREIFNRYILSVD